MIDIATRNLKARTKCVSDDGNWHASPAHHARWNDLRKQQDEGLIADLVLRPVYALRCATGDEVGSFRADIAYRLRATGQVFAEVINAQSPDSLLRWKRKHLLAEHGVESVEVTR